MKFLLTVFMLICMISFSVAPAVAQNFTSQQIDNFVHAYQTVLAYDSSDNVEYIGKASPGSATSAAVWQIQKITYSGSNAMTIKYAGGSSAFSGVWDDRATYTY